MRQHSSSSIAASRKANAKAAKQADPQMKDADARLTQRLQLITENCAKISCESCKAVLKFDEFMAHFDPLKMLNGEMKCSKAPVQKKTSSTRSTANKKGQSRIPRGENMG